MAETKTLSAVSTWQFASRCQAEPERSLRLVFLVGGGPRLVSPTGRWACTAVTASVSRLFLSHSFYFLQLTFCTTEVDVSLEKNTFNSSHSSPPPRNMSPEENGVGGRDSRRGGCHVRRTLTGETGHRRVRALRVAVPPVPWREAPGSRPGSQTSRTRQHGGPVRAPIAPRPRPGKTGKAGRGQPRLHPAGGHRGEVQSVHGSN